MIHRARVWKQEEGLSLEGRNAALAARATKPPHAWGKTTAAKWKTLKHLAAGRRAVFKLADGHMLVVLQTCSGWHCVS